MNFYIQRFYQETCIHEFYLVQYLWCSINKCDNAKFYCPTISLYVQNSSWSDTRSLGKKFITVNKKSIKCMIFCMTFEYFEGSAPSCWCGGGIFVTLVCLYDESFNPGATVYI